MRAAAKTASAILLAGLLVALAAFYCATKLLALQEKTAPDLLIFFEHAQTFMDSGKLYSRETDQTNLAFLYRPSSSEYKFPPAAELLLFPFFIHGTDYLYEEPLPGIKVAKASILTAFRCAGFGIFLISLLITASWCSRDTWQVLSTTRKILLSGLFSATAIASEPLFTNLYYLNLEIPLFFIMSLAALYMTRKPVLAGWLTGFAAGIKIYPAFFAIFLVGTQQYRTLAALVIGALFTLIAGILMFGMAENHFYFSQIFPLISSEPITLADYNFGIGKLLLLAGLSDSVSHSIFNVCRLLIMAAALYCFSIHRIHREKQATRIAIGLIVMLLLLRNYWSAYQVFLFPAYFLLCSSTVLQPSIWRITTLSFCSIVLFLNQDWWGETQLLREVASTDPDTIRQYWDAQSPAEYAIKSWILPMRHSATIIYLLVQCKIVLPVVLWIALATNSGDRHAHR